MWDSDTTTASSWAFHSVAERGSKRPVAQARGCVELGSNESHRRATYTERFGRPRRRAGKKRGKKKARGGDDGRRELSNLLCVRPPVFFARCVLLLDVLQRSSNGQQPLAATASRPSQAACVDRSTDPANNRSVLDWMHACLWKNQAKEEESTASRGFSIEDRKILLLQLAWLAEFRSICWCWILL